MSEAIDLVTAFADHEGADEIDAALCVARILEPAVEPGAVHRQCRDLVDEVRDAFAGDARPQVGALCQYLQEAGFRGAGDQYYALSNSRIDVVLRNRRGIPITLALVYLLAARGLGMDASGVNFPGHFLVRIDNMFVDPYRHHTQTESDCLERVEQRGDPRAAANLLRRATPADFLVRMLNNVRSIFNDEGELPRALEAVQCQRILRPRELGLGVEEARLWERLDVPDQARDTLSELLPWVAHEATREQMTHWIAQLERHGQPTVH